MHSHGFDLFLYLQDVLPGGDRTQFFQGFPVDHTADNVCLVPWCLGISHGYPHQKTVQLCLRQTIGAQLLHRVLGGNDHEKPGKGIGGTVHRDLLFLHGFQKACLGLG